MSGNVEIIGDTKTIDALALKNALNGEIGAALMQIAEVIMLDSKNNFVPVGLTGNLKRSGTVLAPTYGAAGIISVDLGYGEPYARIVHDRAPTIGQGKVKYLEKPFLKHMKAAEKMLLAHVSKGIQTVKKTKRPTSTSLWKQYQEASGRIERTTYGSA